MKIEQGVSVCVCVCVCASLYAVDTARFGTDWLILDSINCV